MSPGTETTIIAAPSTKLTPEELESLIQRERGKGNPWAWFAGSCYDPNDPHDEVYWAAIHEHRREMEAQLEAMATDDESEHSQ